MVWVFYNTDCTQRRISAVSRASLLKKIHSSKTQWFNLCKKAFWHLHSEIKIEEHCDISDKRQMWIFPSPWCLSLINKPLTFYSCLLSHPHISAATYSHTNTHRAQLAGAGKQSSLCLRAEMFASANTAQPTARRVCVCACILALSIH